ncbi:MAG TPA: glycosyltransferase [Chitinophagaceae bacterium]|nr:glycosyltransferase [Chitinophagaceae bacterium]
MKDKQLHIVCLDNPYPPEYGGAIDMFNRIVSLHRLGIRLHVHYFQYGDRNHAEPLRPYCSTLTAYGRHTGWRGFSLATPYIVSSRKSSELAERLNANTFPVLLEGIHCTGILPLIHQNGRRILVRLHNDESRYYSRLSRVASSPLKKVYYWLESRLLNGYQHRLPQDIMYASMTPGDARRFEEVYRLGDVRYLPGSLSWQELTCRPGTGSFCLYHGNLGVAENEMAAIWLLDKIFLKLRIPFVIAGKNPSRRLQKIAHLHQHTCLIANPSEDEIDDLVRKAHINILPSFNATGLKLKLLHALFEGRHCVTNQAAVAGTGLDKACHLGEDAQQLREVIAGLYRQPFEEHEIRLREKLLFPLYDNRKNAELVSQWLFERYP